MAGMFEYYPGCCRLPSYPKTEPFTENPNTWKRSCLTCAKNRRTHRSSIQDSQGQVASNSPSYRVPTNTDQSSKSGELDSTIWTTKLNVSVTQDPFVFKFGCEQKRWLFFFRKHQPCKYVPTSSFWPKLLSDKTQANYGFHAQLFLPWHAT